MSDEDEIKIRITIDNGNASATCWGCDITYDYIKLNGNYRKQPRMFLGKNHIERVLSLKIISSD